MYACALQQLSHRKAIHNSKCCFLHRAVISNDAVPGTSFNVQPRMRTAPAISRPEYE